MITDKSFITNTATQVKKIKNVDFDFMVTETALHYFE